VFVLKLSPQDPGSESRSTKSLNRYGTDSVVLFGSDTEKIGFGYGFRSRHFLKFEKKLQIKQLKKKKCIYFYSNIFFLSYGYIPDYIPV
jgi:hypothetical protein